MITGGTATRSSHGTNPTTRSRSARIRRAIRAHAAWTSWYCGPDSAMLPPPAEAVALANNTRFGLAASVWSENVNLSLDVARKIKAGTVWINTYGLMDASLPFGGYKSSGFGRELGAHVMEHYTELKTVWLNMA